ncbi:MAG: GTPase Era [Magnetococcales bacterium]|nr:GTPase Era [Magnetococcales bacterium]
MSKQQSKAKDSADNFRSGYIAIAGPPNSGKSTFLNRILGRKVAIVTHKAQTTRSKILGVYHSPNCQMVFLDTPGIHDPGNSYLNTAMVKTAFDACMDVDLILYFVDLPGSITEEDWENIAKLPHKSTPIFLVINKVDKIAKPKLMPILRELGEGRDGIVFKELIPISALNGENVDRVLQLIPEYLEVGPKYFPEDQITDQQESFLAAELIREKLFSLLQQELPYSLAVRVDSFAKREVQKGGGKKQKPSEKQSQPDEEIWDMGATIIVDRESQKGIVIGKGGIVLKRVGSAVRKELEEQLGIKLFLKLWVKVKKDWSTNATMLRSFGYPDGLGSDGDNEE